MEWESYSGIQCTKKSSAIPTRPMDKLWGDRAKVFYLKRHMVDGFSQVRFSSKNNLFKWKKESDLTCPLCNHKPQTLEHVLSYSKTALGSGKYNWKHNRVLEELIKFIKDCMKSEPTISIQKFVSESVWIYAGSKQTIKHRAVLGQNLGSSGDFEVTYQDDITITQKQYPAKVCDQTLFFYQERTLKSSR